MSSTTYPEELQEQARALYVPGVFGINRVSRKLGVPRSTIRRWVNPQFAERSRVLSRNYKRTLRGTCSECGGETGYNGHDQQQVSTICVTCSRARQHDERRWTRENVIAAIQLFHSRNGHPPSARDWLSPDRGSDYPCVGAVARYCGWKQAPFATWSDAIRAAGYEPGKAGRPRKR